MSSRRAEKDARRQERLQGTEGKMRMATQRLVQAGLAAGRSAPQLRTEIIRALKDALEIGLLETQSVMVDTRTQRLVDNTAVFKSVINQERIIRDDPKVQAWWLSVVKDELERAVKKPVRA